MNSNFNNVYLNLVRSIVGPTIRQENNIVITRPTFPNIPEWKPKNLNLDIIKVNFTSMAMYNNEKFNKVDDIFNIVIFNDSTINKNNGTKTIFKYDKDNLFIYINIYLINIDFKIIINMIKWMIYAKYADIKNTLIEGFISDNELYMVKYILNTDNSYIYKGICFYNRNDSSFKDKTMFDIYYVCTNTSIVKKSGVYRTIEDKSFLIDPISHFASSQYRILDKKEKINLLSSLKHTGNPGSRLPSIMVKDNLSFWLRTKKGDIVEIKTYHHGYRHEGIEYCVIK